MHIPPPGEEDTAVDLMLEQIAAAAEADERAALLCDLADLLEKSGDEAHALRAIKAAIEESPDQPGLADRYIAQLERAGQHSDLADFLSDRIEWARSAGDDRAGLARRLAELCESVLSDPERAVAAWREVLAERPADHAALAALDRLLASTGRLRDRLEVMRALAQATESRTERASLHRQLAAGYEDLGELEAAAEHLEWALAQDPGDDDSYWKLGRVYLALGRLRAAVDTSLRLAQRLKGLERASLLLEVAGIYEIGLEDTSRALDFCRDAEDVMPGAVEPLREQVRLHELREEHESAAAALERWAARTAGAERAALLARAGRIAEELLSDDVEAVRLYGAALEADRRCVAALRHMARLHRLRGDEMRAARALVHALSVCEVPADRAALALEAGELHEAMGDVGGAMAFYRDALDARGDRERAEPDMITAATHLTCLLWREEMHGELVDALEDLCRMDPDAAAPVRLERLERLAHSARVVGLDRRALAAVRQALPLAEGGARFELQRSEAVLCFRDRAWVDASDAFERLLADGSLPAGLLCSEVVELHHQAGVAAARSRKPDLACQRLGDALALAPRHRESLLALLELVGGEPRRKLEILRSLAAQATGREKCDLQVEIGDLLMAELGNAGEALVAYQGAMEISPDDHILIHKCVDLLASEERWNECRALFDRLIATETEGRVRAKYAHAAALLCRDELEQPDEALRLLWLALEHDPDLRSASAALEDLLRAREVWEPLANLYCKLLSHLGQGGPDDDAGLRDERLRLWTELAEVCWNRLGQKNSAVDALEVAWRLAPDDTARLLTLADRATSAGPAYAARAISWHQALLAAKKQRLVSYAALVELYRETGRDQHATAVAQALAFASPTGTGVRPRPRSDSPALGQHALTAEMWTALRHPGEDAAVGAALSLIAPVVAIAAATSRKRLGLELRGAEALPDDAVAGRMLARVSAALGMSRPLALACPELRAPIDVRVLEDRGAVRPVLLLGAPLLSGASERQVAFHLGRALASLRGGGILRWLMPRPEQIALLLEAAAQLADQNGAAEPSAAPENGLTSTLRAIERALTPLQREQLVVLGRRIRDRGLLSEAAARAWLTGHDLSIARVGLVACGDLATALDVMSADPASAGSRTPGGRAAEMVWSAASEAILDARAHLEEWYLIEITETSPAVLQSC